MKLIKCGSSQTRIAQACDRCRSKKIRCDGIRPCCSQCSNVGFECKTSDKLSRRAFPRGYTESLEERVRVLEQETRELKELLDAKDEQLDMLSRIHSFSPYSPPASSVSHRRSPASARSESAEIVEDTFLVHETPSLVVGGGGGDDVASGFYVGSSSGRSFVGILIPSSDFILAISYPYSTKCFYEEKRKKREKRTIKVLTIFFLLERSLQGENTKYWNQLPQRYVLLGPDIREVTNSNSQYTTQPTTE